MPNVTVQPHIVEHELRKGLEATNLGDALEDMIYDLRVADRVLSGPAYWGLSCLYTPQDWRIYAIEQWNLARRDLAS